MRCFYNFILNGFSNTYLLGPDIGGDAILVDPGELNIKLFRLIEDHDLYVRHILVTHDDPPHTGGIKTLLKIYDAKVYGRSLSIGRIRSVEIEDGKVYTLSGFEIRSYHVKHFGLKSVMYKVGNILFTGDTLGAGRVNKKIMQNMNEETKETIKARLLSMDDNTLVFPAHGPPSTIKVERMFNPDIKNILEGYHPKHF